MFQLHPQLEKDSFPLGELTLCQILLMNDANYPWIVLVPKRADICEIYQLVETDQQLLMKESDIIARILVELFAPDKLNIAALGNIVPQLHVHHIVRYRNDAAWPSPVWGKHAAIEYTETERDKLVRRFNTLLVKYTAIE